MTTVNVQRKHWRNVTLLAGAGLALSPLTAPPVHGAQKEGCCEAVIMWSGPLRELALLSDRDELKRSVPPDWAPIGPTMKFYLPKQKDLSMIAVLGVSMTSRPSRARYRWEVECLQPAFRRYTDWTWTDVPGRPNATPDPPLLPIKNVYGTINTGDCTDGWVWFHYDQGDPDYGTAKHNRLAPGATRTVPANFTVWKWVTQSQATTVTQTGKYPVPKDTTFGQYFFTTRAYADSVANLFPNHRLVQGTLPAADLIYNFTENTTSDTGIVGGFFRKDLTQPTKTFKVVK